MRTILLGVLLAAVAACGKNEPAAAPPAEAPGENHEHKPQHGGDVMELGDHEGFVEVKADHDAGTLTVWVYAGEEMKPAPLAEPPLLNWKGMDGPRQLQASMSGGAWVFQDAALEGEIEGARFRLSLGGKVYTPVVEHAHHDVEESAPESEGCGCGEACNTESGCGCGCAEGSGEGCGCGCDG